MTISQGRNADNRSELPGVAASQLTRNKAYSHSRIRKLEHILALTDRLVCGDLICKHSLLCNCVCLGMQYEFVIAFKRQHNFSNVIYL